MTSSIFLQTEPNKIVFGTGILKRSAAPSQERPSFYLNDFFLGSSTPWVIPEKVEVLDLQEALTRFSEDEDTESNVTWNAPDHARFRATFDEIQALIKKGILQKAVPMVFENGTLHGSSHSLLPNFAAKLVRHSHAHLYLYGYAQNGSGMIGLSPELLFSKKDLRISTAALAGTQSAELLDVSLKNQKDMSEHNFVVRDLMEKLSALGQVSSQETVAYNVGSLVHLRTPIAAKLNSDANFETIVQTLHPSAALGVYPSSPEALRFLRHDDETSPRGHFAAPIGVHFPNGDGFCIAAIRCIQWEDTTIRIGSGCGIVAESIFEAEYEELRMKRDSIKSRVFGKA